MTTEQEILEEFKKKCILNKDGHCKYWKPEAFGYAKKDTEAPLDKFFPEKIKSFLLSSLSKYRQSVLGEVGKELKKFGVILEQRDELEGREAIYEFIKKLNSLNK